MAGFRRVSLAGSDIYGNNKKGMSLMGQARLNAAATSVSLFSHSPIPPPHTPQRSSCQKEHDSGEIGMGGRGLATSTWAWKGPGIQTISNPGLESLPF
jgi:hypothetical protein